MSEAFDVGRVHEGALNSIMKRPLRVRKEQADGDPHGRFWRGIRQGRARERRVSQTALEGLAQAKSALELALDGADTRLIDSHCERFRSAIYAVRAAGAWRQNPDLARMAADMLGRVEVAQQRVKNLTRDTRERLAALEMARTRTGLTLYERRESAAR